jgi:hypothetical protein
VRSRSCGCAPSTSGRMGGSPAARFTFRPGVERDFPAGGVARLTGPPGGPKASSPHGGPLGARTIVGREARAPHSAPDRGRATIIDGGGTGSGLAVQRRVGAEGGSLTLLRLATASGAAPTRSWPGPPRAQAIGAARGVDARSPRGALPEAAAFVAAELRRAGPHAALFRRQRTSLCGRRWLRLGLTAHVHEQHLRLREASPASQPANQRV